MHYGSLTADNGSNVSNLSAIKFWGVYCNSNLLTTEIYINDNDCLSSICLSITIMLHNLLVK